MEKKIKQLIDEYDEGNMSLGELETKLVELCRQHLDKRHKTNP